MCKQNTHYDLPLNVIYIIRRTKFIVVKDLGIK